MKIDADAVRTADQDVSKADAAFKASFSTPGLSSAERWQRFDALNRTTSARDMAVGQAQTTLLNGIGLVGKQATEPFAPRADLAAVPNDVKAVTRSTSPNDPYGLLVDAAAHREFDARPSQEDLVAMARDVQTRDAHGETVPFISDPATPVARAQHRLYQSSVDELTRVGRNISHSNPSTEEASNPFNQVTDMQSADLANRANLLVPDVRHPSGDAVVEDIMASARIRAENPIG